MIKLQNQLDDILELSGKLANWLIGHPVRQLANLVQISVQWLVSQFDCV